MNEIFSTSDNDKGFGRKAKLGKGSANARREKMSVKSEGAGKVTLTRWHVNKTQEEVREWLLLLSRFSRIRLCATPQVAAHQAPRPWDSPGKNTGVGCHFLLQCMKVKHENEVA